AGSGYTLTAELDSLGTTLAAVAGVNTALSGAFTVNTGPASKLLFTTSPSSAIAGNTISLVVALADSGSNTVTSATNTIGVGILSGTGVTGATLGGTSSKAASSGVASFSLTIDKAGTGYQLAASSNGLPTISTSAFTVSPNAAVKLAYTVAPTATLTNALI